MMNVFLELILVLIQSIWLWLVAIYKALVPAKWQGMKDVKGQLVLITGAGSGLGRMMALRFAELGANLVLWDINKQGNEETAKMAQAKGVEVKTYTVDLSKRADIYEAAGKVKTEVGNVNILINNAGIVTGRKFMDCPDELIEKTMDVNINAHFWTVKSFLPAMLEQNHGHIVSIASSAGFFGVTGLADYCASKFAAVGFDESLRQEISVLGKTGVKTTVVCPYFINTGMFEGVRTRFPFLLPILEPEVVVNSIMEAILTNQAMLLTPKSVYHLLALKNLMPVEPSFKLGHFLGVTSSMESFVGRAKNK